MNDELEQRATLIKDMKGKLYILVGGRKIKCEGKTELRQRAGDFIRSL